ncbi:MAG: LytTR family DNA-binding domain-containing protein [Bryobacteraceae bacterium]|nr:LytTR family DNA-binding domain-containing protein [Bryobacteraceae bacterium]
MSVRATSTISVLLADDEQLARDELAFLLKDFSDFEVLTTASNGIEALQLIERHEPDVVFLDVDMPGLNGLGVIRRLQEKGIPLPFFVLATAHENYAVEAFRLEAMDYLLKPIDRDRLVETLERIRRVVYERQRAAEQEPPPEPADSGERRSKLVVKAGQRNLIIDVQDLIYATIDEGLITVVTTQCEGETFYRTIEELQSNLDPEIFWRVHRSYLVNVNRIREVIPWFKSSFQIRMDDKRGTEIPVSRVQTKRLRMLFRL